jgi:hypothetical protein
LAIWGGAVLATPGVAYGSVACGDLQALSFHQTTITSATVVPADAISGRPEHCQVNATVSPHAESHIGVVYRLPVADRWNGRLLGIGSGGWAAT